MTADQLKQMSDRLIKLLRDNAEFWDAGNDIDSSTPLRDAADALEAQQALITRLISQRDAQEVLIGEHIAAQREAERRLDVEKTRLDFMIDERVWIQWTVRDGSIRQCQVYDQGEDENYIIRSGEDRFYNMAREAIDAALSAATEGGE